MCEKEKKKIFLRSSKTFFVCSETFLFPEFSRVCLVLLSLSSPRPKRISEELKIR